MPDADSHTCAGANTGIGFETAKALAVKGYATVLACRNLEKGRAARDKIRYQPPCLSLLIALPGNIEERCNAL